MGYRLHASVYHDKFPAELCLGKLYDEKWNHFKEKWFNAESWEDRDDVGYGVAFFIKYQDLLSFIDEFKKITLQPGEYSTYNIDLFQEMVDFCVFSKINIHFEFY